jgi:hypothetical protein
MTTDDGDFRRARRTLRDRIVRLVDRTSPTVLAESLALGGALRAEDLRTGRARAGLQVRARESRGDLEIALGQPWKERPGLVFGALFSIAGMACILTCALSGFLSWAAGAYWLSLSSLLGATSAVATWRQARLTIGAHGVELLRGWLPGMRRPIERVRGVCAIPHRRSRDRWRWRIGLLEEDGAWHPIGPTLARDDALGLADAANARIDQLRMRVADPYRAAPLPTRIEEPAAPPSAFEEAEGSEATRQC